MSKPLAPPKCLPVSSDDDLQDPQLESREEEKDEEVEVELHFADEEFAPPLTGGEEFFLLF